MTNYPDLPDYSYYCLFKINCTCGTGLTLPNDCTGGSNSNHDSGSI